MDFHYNASRYLKTLFSTEAVTVFMVIRIITKLITLLPCTKYFSKRQKVYSGAINPNSDHFPDPNKTMFPPIRFERRLLLWIGRLSGLWFASPKYDVRLSSTNAKCERCGRSHSIEHNWIGQLFCSPIILTLNQLSSQPTDYLNVCIAYFNTLTWFLFNPLNSCPIKNQDM